jgi:oligopeptide transport system substrate-binding protein
MIRPLALGAALLLAAACTATPGAGGAKAPVEDATQLAQRIADRHLRRQMQSDPRTFDPSLSTDVQGQQIFDDIFEGLLSLDAKGDVAPGVATRWESSSGGSVWTFHLDPKAQWSNGDPVTARDFVYSWRRIVDPATASLAAEQLTPMVNADAIIAGKLPKEQLGVRAIDDQTLEVRLVAPTPYFLYLLTTNYLLPVPEPAITRYGSTWVEPGKIVSNGPFVLESMRINGAIQLKRNPRFHRAASVWLERVTWYPVTDESDIASRFLAGDLDTTDRFAASDLPWLRERLGSQVRLAPYYGIVALGFNVTRKPFDSQPLRLALSMAVDRELLTGKLLNGAYVPAYNLIPASPGYTPVVPDWAGWSVEKRHARARELYAQAGYSAHHPLVVDLSYPSSSAENRRTFEALTAMWQVNLGAEVRLYSDEWKVHQNNRHLGKYALFWDGWIGDYPDPLTFLQLWQKASGNNYTFYSDPRYEALVAKAVATGDPAERMRLYREAEAIGGEASPNVPLYFYQSKHLLKPSVAGWVSNLADRNSSQFLSLVAQPGT